MPNMHDPSTQVNGSWVMFQGARVRPAMSSGTATGTLAPAAYRRNAALTAAAVALKYPGGSMKPHSLNGEPALTARR